MADQSDNNSTQSEDQNQPSVKEYLIANKYDTCFWLIRLYIIFSSILYLLPLFGVEFSQNCFKRVLIASAALSALRLHQRMPRIQFNIDFAKQLVLEDSFHYFIYSVLFLMSGHITVVLMPIFIFAVMHSASYTRKVINVSRSQNSLVGKLSQLIAKIENREMQQQMLSFIATSEILVFVTAVVMVFSNICAIMTGGVCLLNYGFGGRGSLLVPFFYYRFLQLRYSSRRNPYSRLVFNQLRIAIDGLSNHPKCPGIGRKLLQAVVAVALRLAPATAQA